MEILRFATKNKLQPPACGIIQEVPKISTEKIHDLQNAKVFSLKNFAIYNTYLY